MAGFLILTLIHSCFIHFTDFTPLAVKWKNSQTDLVSENEILSFFNVFNPFTNIYV